MGYIHLEEVSKSYQQAEHDIHILDKLSLEITKGETVAILGQSGSGKSTLLSLLAGLDRPNSGRIKLNNQDINTMSEEQLSIFRGQHMGIVFQDFHLMKHLNAWENVALPLQIFAKDSPKKKSIEALNKVGLIGRTDHFPDQLSGGEQQRVAIARAFVGNPEIILADEPSGNLDQETGKLVMTMLFDLIKENNSTLILVTHDQELATHCSTKLKLSKGKLTKA